MRTITRILASLIIGIFLFIGLSCKKDKDEDYKKSDFNSADEILKNPDVKKALNAASVVIHKGVNPPDIEGEYLTNECVYYDASENAYAMVGLSPNSTFRLYNQYSNGSISFSEVAGGVSSQGYGAFITGEGDYFTIWLESNNSTGSTSILIISGEKLSNGNLSIQGITIYTIPDAGYVKGDWWAYSGSLINKNNMEIEPPYSVNVDYDDGCMEVSWSEVDNAEYYNVYRSTSGSGYYELIDYTYYTSISDCYGLDEGSKYYYKVTAVNSYDIESEMSNYGYATVPESTTIDPPTGLSVTYNSSTGCMNISWNYVSGATEYVVYWSSSSGGSFTTVISRVSSTYTTDCSGMTVGTTHYYKVAAVNSSGIESAKSNYAYATVTSSGGNSDITSDITFYNNVFTDVYITIGSSTKVAKPEGSVTFYSVQGSSATFSAYTSGATSSGTQVGLKLTWDNSVSLTGDPQSFTLSASSTYFFLYMKNTGSVDLNPIYVNYGLSSQTKDNVVIPNDGTKYRLGYYKAWSNSNVRAYHNGTSTYSYWNQGTHFTLPFTKNQSVTLTNTSKKSDHNVNEKQTVYPCISFIAPNNTGNTMGCKMLIEEKRTISVPNNDYIEFLCK